MSRSKPTKKEYAQALARVLDQWECYAVIGGGIPADEYRLYETACSMVGKTPRVPETAYRHKEAF